VRLISLTQNKFAIVDDESYEKLDRLKWYTQKTVNEFLCRLAKKTQWSLAVAMN